MISFAQEAMTGVRATIYLSADEGGIPVNAGGDSCPDHAEEVSLGLSAGIHELDFGDRRNAYAAIERKAVKAIPVSDQILSFLGASMGRENVCDEGCTLIGASSGCERIALQDASSCREMDGSLFCSAVYRCTARCIPGEQRFHFPEVKASLEQAPSVMGALRESWQYWAGDSPASLPLQPSLLESDGVSGLSEDTVGESPALQDDERQGRSSSSQSAAASQVSAEEEEVSAGGQAKPQITVGVEEEDVSAEDEALSQSQEALEEASVETLSNSEEEELTETVPVGDTPGSLPESYGSDAVDYAACTHCEDDIGTRSFDTIIMEGIPDVCRQCSFYAEELDIFQRFREGQKAPANDTRTNR